MGPRRLRSCRLQRSCHALAITVLLTTLAGCTERNETDSLNALQEGFQSPPNSARPRVWWHWMNGNVTKDGIEKDFAWMKRIGIGGVQTFDASLGTPQIVEQRLVYMTPEWQDAFRFAANEAERLGLELTIASSPGWSETGGPWVKPENGLKKLVWSEIVVAGGQLFDGELPAPPSVTGPYQGLGKASLFAMAGEADAKPAGPAFYADVAVLAYPDPERTIDQGKVAQGKMQDGQGRAVQAALLIDGDLSSGVQLERSSADEISLLQIDYPEPQTVRSASIFAPGAILPFVGAYYEAELQASVDGKQWQRLSELALTPVPTTVAFAPVTAAHFRVLFRPWPEAFDKLKPAGEGVVGHWNPAMLPMMMMRPLQVTQLQLLVSERVDRAEAKAGFTIERDYYALSQGVPQAEGVDPAAIIDLTDKLDGDGRLQWTAPPGRWKILRLGYSLTGTTNHPAPPEATGLEVDKFDGAAVRDYMEQYLQSYADTLGEPIAAQSMLDAILTDSIEVGAANWTPKLVAQFKQLRGYDPTPWLPALTGILIGSRQQTDRFLFDFRRTLADLMASEHYGTVAQVAHEHGLKVYGEALEDQRPSLGDDMAMRRYADVPMAAMWTEPRPNMTYIADIKGAASVAHLYGQNLVGAESLTAFGAPWAHAPVDLKRTMDLEFVLGVNRPIIHTSVHVPEDDKLPGLSLGGVGQFFNRNDTWAEMAGPWVEYISRNAFLLQQGRYFADVAFFYGEEAPLTGLYGERTIDEAPRRFGYDFVNTDVLLNLLKVEEGALVAASGARYQVLYLGGSSQQMTLSVLRRLQQMAERGATIIGRAPLGSPSLADRDQAEFDQLVASLWSGNKLTKVGAGRVVDEDNLEVALAELGVVPDFTFDGGSAAASVPFLHRRLGDGDLYFVVNRSAHAEEIEARFRVTGKAPQLWHADSGVIEAVSYRIEGEQTVVPLQLEANDALFVVFREPAKQPSLTLARPQFRQLTTLSGPWQLRFQPARGAPESVVMSELSAWNEQADAGIKYFSGIGSYEKTLTTPESWQTGEPLWLDLGEVRDLAEVIVNGQSLAVLWHPPYRVDISKAIKPGANQLQLRVANLWVNRLIGDQQADATPVTYTDKPTYRADAPLRRSGLLGPVSLLQSVPAAPH